MVGIADPKARLGAYPHQLSGGQRQRVMIAIALGCNPKLLIADEATTALDVTIQAQILELMKKLTAKLGTALIIITHNLGLVARYADRVNVMYAGRIRESGPVDDIYSGGATPVYGRALELRTPARSVAQHPAQIDSGRDSGSRQPAERLRLQIALRLGGRSLRDRRSAAHASGPRPLDRVLGARAGGRRGRW